ncbi:MAG: hypothetical protein V9E94_08230 [Microthrixaceae bacterium]
MTDKGDRGVDEDEVAVDGPGPGPDVELEDGQLAYDCTTWAGESRGLLTSLLSSKGIAHVWQGTVLTVREVDEDAVDELIDDVLVAARPALDPDAAKLVYEVGSWPVAIQTELTDALTAADIAYEWNEQGDLVVREVDEDAVEAVLDELPEPDEGGISSDDGVALHDLLDSLFMAADRLARHPADPSSTISVVDDVEVVGQVALPFGFEPQQWRHLVDAADALAAAITADTTDTEAADSVVVELASTLREVLSQYV